MATLTIRNLSVRVMHGLAALARQRNTSMEQEAQRLLEDYLTERASVEKQIEASWSSTSLGKATPSSRFASLPDSMPSHHSTGRAGVLGRHAADVGFDRMAADVRMRRPASTFLAPQKFPETSHGSFAPFILHIRRDRCRLLLSRDLSMISKRFAAVAILGLLTVAPAGAQEEIAAAVAHVLRD